MKNWISVLLISSIFIFSISCEKTPVEPDKKVPVITTTAVTAITQTSAISGGSIVSDEGSIITVSGICWSTNPTPTIADFKTEDGTLTGTFASNIESLIPETTYYVCAYATNGEGTGYGNILSFSTEDLFLASTEQENRKALLEDFTGVRCGFCPQGHTIAANLSSLYPDKFIAIAVHAGGYAAPATGWPNFTTPYGNILVGSAKVAGYPAGTINRKLATDLGVSPQTAGGMAMSRASWQAAAEAVMQLPAPVNIGAQATFNPVNRELSIRVDLYYTGNAGSSNYINVALLQDKIMSKQSGAPNPSSYEQNHVLRELITGQWGEKNVTTAIGSKITKTYTYTLPTDYNGLGAEGGGAVVIDDLKVVAFVCQSGKDVLNATAVDVE